MKQILQKLCLLTSFVMLSATNVWADDVIKNVEKDQTYATILAAFNDAEDGQTIQLLANYDATGESGYAGNNRFIGFDKSLTIDGNNHTLTVKGRGIAIGQNTNTNTFFNVTFKDITIKNSNPSSRCIDTRGHIGTLTLDHAILDTQGSTSAYNQPLTIGGNQATAATVNIINGSVIRTNLDATAYYAIITFNPVNMTISESTISGWAALYMKGVDSSAGSAGSNVTINNSTINSMNVYSGVSNAFGAITFEDKNINVEITNSNINVNATGDQPQGIVCDDELSGNTVTLGVGNTVTLSGNGCFTIDTPETLSITGGTFNTDPSYFVADGYGAVKVADNVWKVAAITSQTDAGDQNTTESYIVIEDNAAVTTVTTAEGATSVTIPAEINSATVTSIAENAFDEVTNKDEIQSIDLSATSITGIEVNRSEGVFADFPEETLIYMPAGNTAATGEKNVIIDNGGGDLVCNDLLLTDTKSYNIPKVFTATDVKLERSFTENKSCTICLPFALNTTGINGTFAYFDEIDGDNNIIYMQAVDANSTLTAYQPYIFIPAGDFDNMVNENTNLVIGITETANKVTHQDTNGHSFDFTGTLEYKKFNAQEIQDGVYGFAANETDGAHIGDFVKGSEGCYIQGLRAYLICECSHLDTHDYNAPARSADDVEENNEVSNEMNVVLRDVNGHTTNIGQMEVVRHYEGTVYNLKGEKTNKNNKGIYIIDGQKVMVK